ncbi:MAG: class I SAM-dependent methyltransferase [Minisyncoccota bacterium]
MFAFSDPKKNIDQCGIQPGMIIADFGAGSGMYTLEAAKALASTGQVYAVDIQKDLLTRIKNDAQKENLSNVEVLWGDIEKIGGTHIKDNFVDLILVCNILFQVEDKKSVMEEAKRILGSGGRLLLVDWSDSFGGIGPHKDKVFSKEKAEELFLTHGFSKDREIQAGSHHYGFIYKKL